MNQFLWGALAALAAVITLFFLKFWKRTGDRLFALFATAFFALSLNWTILAIVDPSDESRHRVFFVRLLAFGLIIGGVIDKNRRSRREPK